MQSTQLPETFMVLGFKLILTGSAGTSPTPDMDFRQLMTSRDAITPNQDFMICPHPHSKNLYLATGGSFHGWKFLPIIGKYVVMMINEELPEEHRIRWAWNRTNEGAACVMYTPRRDIKDIDGSDLVSI